MELTVIKRDKRREEFDPEKLKHCIKASFRSAHVRYRNEVYDGILNAIDEANQRRITVEAIQDIIERYLMSNGYEDVAKHYILYRKEHERIREWVNTKKAFIEAYKKAYNTADATVDDNSNMSNKNIGVMNNEIHKPDNVQISRRMVVDKLTELFPAAPDATYPALTVGVTEMVLLNVSVLVPVETVADVPLMDAGAVAEPFATAFDACVA